MTEPHRRAAWREPHEVENIAPVAIAILVAAGLQYFLPPHFVLIHPQWPLPALELALLALLIALGVSGAAVRHVRVLGLAVVALISIDNTVSSGLLVSHLIQGSSDMKALPLLVTGGSIYVTNVISFGIWYWQLDRGGPYARAHVRNPYPDFLFPQMTQEGLTDPSWRPLFADYLYVSFTNATAFSPTDVMPLTRRAKALFTVQSLVALVTMALVLARAVNILN